jgi:peptidoglycan-N-acetylglucosamine deacetylase
MHGALMLGLLAAVSVSNPKRPIVVTVDDLPIAAGDLHPDSADRRRITSAMLGVLEKHHIKAVGLVTFSRVKSPADRALLEEWLAHGHELGNHSFGHLDYTKADPRVFIDDVERGRRELEALLAPHEKSVRFFRFPFLDEGETKQKLELMREYLAKTKQTNLPVTIDDQDWSFEDRWVSAKRAADQASIERIASEFRATMRMETQHFEGLGDSLFGRVVPEILLLHAGEVGADLWDELFNWLEIDHRFVSVDEALSDAAFQVQHVFAGEHGVSLWDRIRTERRAAEASKQIADLLEAQAKAWNRGDHEAFCAAYADDATFISPSGLTQGRSAIVERYKKKYTTKEKMGTLTMEILEQRFAWGFEVSRFIDSEPSRIHGAGVILRWKLAYPDKPEAQGLSLISLRKRPGQKDSWMIVQDASM